MLEVRWITPDWPVPPCVRALSTERMGGVSAQPFDSLNLGAHVGDEPPDVAENRRRLAQAVELPSEPVWLDQIHGTGVVDLDRLSGAEVPTADAAITRSPGRVCAILTADCLPVLFASERGDVIGAAHAGWRGLAGGVLESAVRAIGCDTSSLIAWIGPGISACHFEVGGEVRDAFLQTDPQSESAFAANRRGRYMADLPGLARSRLARMGILRVHGADVCTFAARDRYFSHRRDGRTGRQGTLIWLERGLRDAGADR